jgi:multiple sugar transport system substrate-binding protein
MKRIKFTAMLALVFSLLISVVACGSNGNTGKGDAGKASPSSSPKETPKPQKIDLGGREIRISNWWDGTPKADTAEGEQKLKRQQEIEKKYNVKIKYLNTDYWETSKKLSATVLAGDPFADIVNLPDGFIWSLISGGFLTPLEDFISLKNESRISEEVLNAMKFGTDKTYAFITHFTPNDSGVFYNKRIFQEAGIKNPQQLQNEDKWDWNAMLEAAKKLTVDKNGDGKIDQYGLANAHYMLATYLIYSNEAVIFDEKTKKVAFDSPNAMEALNFMYDLYNVHKVVKPNAGDDWTNPSKFFANGEVAMYPGGTWEIAGRIKDKLKDDWGYVYLPKGPKAKKYSDPMTQATGNVIPKGVKDPRIVFQIWQDLQDFDKLAADNKAAMENSMPDQTSVNNALNKDNKAQKVFGRFGGLGIKEAIDPLTKIFITGEDTPASGVAKVISQAQAKVDETLNSVKK